MVKLVEVQVGEDTWVEGVVTEPDEEGLYWVLLTGGKRKGEMIRVEEDEIRPSAPEALRELKDLMRQVACFVLIHRGLLEKTSVDVEEILKMASDVKDAEII